MKEKFIIMRVKKFLKKLDLFGVNLNFKYQANEI